MERPVCFFSRKMQPAETNYPIYDKELLGIVAALEEWQHYLLYARHQIIIRTDHKALEYHKAPHRMNQRQARWHIELSQYDFKIEYKPGKLNVLPDILSRDPAHVFLPQDLDVFNTGTMLPSHRFALISENYSAFRKRIVDSQANSPLGKRVLSAFEKGTLSSAFQ